MTKLLLLLIFPACLFSCNSSEEGYVNYEKLKTLDSFAGRLKGKPKEVKEDLFVDLTDTSFSSNLSGVHREHYIYQFDKAGNCVFTKVVLDTLLTNEAYYKFDESGIHYESTIYSHGDTTHTSRSKKVSRKIGPGKYETDKYYDGEKKYTDRVTFLDHGKKVISQRIGDTSILFTDTLFYTNGDLTRSSRGMEGMPGLVMSNIYYYSDKGFLDSVIWGKTGDKFLYVNNSYGDPVYYEEIEEGEKVRQRWMKYEYDKAGNWIKRIDKEDSKKRFNIPSADTPKIVKYPGYSLTIREIKY